VQATFLEDSNPCGVLLCGPVDPLAVMHTSQACAADGLESEFCIHI